LSWYVVAAVVWIVRVVPSGRRTVTDEASTALIVPVTVGARTAIAATTVVPSDWRVSRKAI
jgi:hypothetical protein